MESYYNWESKSHRIKKEYSTLNNNTLQKHDNTLINLNGNTSQRHVILERVFFRI